MFLGLGSNYFFERAAGLITYNWTKTPSTYTEEVNIYTVTGSTIRSTTMLDKYSGIQDEVARWSNDSSLDA